MTSASNAGTTATYIYNALGQRIRRATSGATTIYVYDEAGHLTGEYTAAGGLIQETVWLGETPVATLRPNGTGGVNLYYVHTDHLNSPRIVTDSANNIRWRWDSDPFGTTPPNQNPSGLGTFEYNLRFPGQQYDQIVGLHYNYFRNYDPTAGRYLEADPAGVTTDISLYQYASADPVQKIDPLGLEALPNSGRGKPGSYPNCLKWPGFPTRCSLDCVDACALKQVEMIKDCNKSCRWRYVFPHLLISMCGEASREWLRQCVDQCGESPGTCRAGQVHHFIPSSCG
jgi:RHS repeat-associated protein